MKRQRCRKSASILPLFYLKAGYKFSSYWRQTLISPERHQRNLQAKLTPLSIISSHMFTFPGLAPWEGFPLSCHPSTRGLLWWRCSMSQSSKPPLGYLSCGFSPSTCNILFPSLLLCRPFPCKVYGRWPGKLKASCVVHVCSSFINYLRGHLYYAGNLSLSLSG